MKRFTLAAIVTASIALGTVVQAQVVDRVWDNGSVWQINYVSVKPGQFNAYMKFLNQVALPRIAGRKQTGDILSYHVLAVNSPRATDPDVVVITEFKNMAVFDRAPSFGEDFDRKMAGSLEARQAQMATVRTLIEPKGGMLAREMTFLR